MNAEIISVLSVVFFCLCSRQLIVTALKPIPILKTERPYSRGAMLIGKTYKVMSWGTLTASFFGALVISFYQVYTQL